MVRNERRAHVSYPQNHQPCLDMAPFRCWKVTGFEHVYACTLYDSMEYMTLSNDTLRFTRVHESQGIHFFQVLKRYSLCLDSLLQSRNFALENIHLKSEHIQPHDYVSALRISSHLRARAHCDARACFHGYSRQMTWSVCFLSWQ